MNAQELRNLDAQICQHVMGWKRINNIQRLGKGGEFFLHASDGPFVHERQNYIKKFSPSTDPAAAMMVLEKCIARIEWSRIISFGSTADGGYFINQSDSEPGSEAFCTAEADTLPLAICLFARKLFKVREDK